MLEATDRVLTLINESADPKLRLNYNRHYVGLHDGTRSTNFVYFRPRKQHINMMVSVPSVPDWVKRLDDAGLEATERNERVRVAFDGKDLEKHRAIISELLKAATDETK